MLRSVLLIRKVLWMMEKESATGTEIFFDVFYFFLFIFLFIGQYQ